MTTPPHGTRNSSFAPLGAVAEPAHRLLMAVLASGCWASQVLLSTDFTVEEARRFLSKFASGPQRHRFVLDAASWPLASWLPACWWSRQIQRSDNISRGFTTGVPAPSTDAARTAHQLQGS